MLTSRIGTEARPTAPPLARSPRRRWRSRVGVVALAAVFLLALSGIAFAADRAVPCDPLYGVDRAMERLQVAMARSPEGKANAHLENANERLEEIQVLLSRGDEARIAQTVQDLEESEAMALESAGKALGRDFEALHAHVLAMIGTHAERLAEVRTRLEASGHASERALEALQRAIDNASKAAENVHQGWEGLGADTGSGSALADRAITGRMTPTPMSPRTRAAPPQRRGPETRFSCGLRTP